MHLQHLSYTIGPSLHQFEGSTLLPISMGVCLLWICFLLPKSEYSLSKGPMNWGDHSTWISPGFITSLSRSQFFLALKRIGLKNAYSAPSITLQPELYPQPSIALPFVPKDLLGASLPPRVGLCPNFQPPATTEGKCKYFTKEKQFGEHFSRNTPTIVFISFMGYKDWWVGMEELQLAAFSGKLVFPSKWTSLSACSSDHESQQ